MNHEKLMSVLVKRPMSGLLSTLFVAILLVFGGVFVACGDGNDDPADCTSDEYYNEASGRCTICPAVQEPECREGCGFTIERDDRSCPVAVCSATCDLCDDGEVFSDELLSCVASE